MCCTLSPGGSASHGSTLPCFHPSVIIFFFFSSLRENMVWDGGVERPTGLLDVSGQAVNLSINVLVSMEAMLTPTNALACFVRQVQSVQQTQGLSEAQLYCQLMRTGLMGMIQAARGPEEVKWAALTYLKVPTSFPPPPPLWSHVPLLAASEGSGAAEQRRTGCRSYSRHVPSG